MGYHNSFLLLFKRTNR